MPSWASGDFWAPEIHKVGSKWKVYMYFEVPDDQVVFHMMGQGSETRHIIMRNEEAVISPSWSIHAGAGTSNYTFTLQLFL